MLNNDTIERFETALALKDMPNKEVVGKPRLHLAPRQIIYDITEVREYGIEKYHDPDNWKTVDLEYYIDAAYRHFLAMVDDPNSCAPDSGIKHYKHLACNIAFICEFLKDK